MEFVFLISLFPLLIPFTTADSVHYEDCGSTANVTDMRVSGCSSPPCVFIKGKRYEIEIDAISNCSSNKLPYKVTAKVVVPFTILKGNACDVLTQGSCPVSPGADFTYKNVINVSTSYPSFHTKVTALVRDDVGDSVICLKLDVIIRKKSTKSQKFNLLL